MTRQLVIGSAEGCDFRVHGDVYVSGEHAVVLVVSETECRLADLGSTNGTWLRRGSELLRVTTPVRLEPGDIIRIGRTDIPWRNVGGGG